MSGRKRIMSGKTEIAIHVAGDDSCRILSGDGLDGLCLLLSGYMSVYVVYDRNAVTHVEQALEHAVEGGINVCGKYPLTATEENKTVDTVMDICRWLMETGADRKSLLLVFGGGITTDVAGFAASIYRRGIRFAFVPTTLLAQVDASIGGKNGVNIDSYKNMAGVIRQPDFIYICPAVLKTLEYRTFLSGAAEMLKTFIIAAPGYYAKAVEFLSWMHGSLSGGVQGRMQECYGQIVRSHRREITDMIMEAVAIKAGIVSEDAFESGERRKLNLGHTFAHAFEWYGMADAAHCPDAGTGQEIPHGAAVSMGIIMAARLSEALGVCRPGLASMLMHDFSSCGLPVACPFPPERLAGAMARDKKSENGNIHFILIRDIGSVIEYDMTAETAASTLAGSVGGHEKTM